MTGIDAIAELFSGPGARDYLGEAVTIGEHMRQAGALAAAAGVPAPLVAAALLHDVGHLLGESDARHGSGGARWLSRWFGPAVTEPVRLHVAAKRYLCATEPGYSGLLSAGRQPPGSGRAAVRDRALTAVELRTLKATERPR